MSSLRFFALGVVVSGFVAPLMAQTDSATLQMSVLVPQSGLTNRAVPGIPLDHPAGMRLLEPGQASGVCFAIRSRHFAVNRAAPDVVRPTGSTTCQPAAQFKLKGAGIRVPR